jgi:hypothetical protein
MLYRLPSPEWLTALLIHVVVTAAGIWLLRPLPPRRTKRRSAAAICTLRLRSLLCLGWCFVDHAHLPLLVLVRHGFARDIFPIVRESVVHDSSCDRLVAHASSVSSGTARVSCCFALLYCGGCSLDFIYRAVGQGMKRSNQSMKPTAPLRYNFSVFAKTPCRGLSLSR